MKKMHLTTLVIVIMCLCIHFNGVLSHPQLRAIGAGNGVTINATDQQAESDNSRHAALLSAASRGRVKSVKLLLENGANVNVVNSFNNTPLIIAISSGYDKIAELLIQSGADVNIVGQYSKTALIWAVEQGFEEIVQTLIDKGADINGVDENNNSAFMYAANNVQDRENP